jgi:hypothetical protein
MADRPGRSSTWLRGLFGKGRRDVPAPHPGREALTAGGRALWTLAARTVDAIHAVDVPAGGGSDLDGAAHVFGGPARIGFESDARAAVAGAAGAALAGRRAAAFVPGHALPALVPTLASAARRHVPLTVVAAHEPDAVATHAAFHAAATAGVPLFVARDGQHAVDLLTLAIRVAEDSLTPVVVTLDGPSAAWAPASLHLPQPDRLRAWLGHPDDTGRRCPRSARTPRPPPTGPC